MYGIFDAINMYFGVWLCTIILMSNFQIQKREKDRKYKHRERESTRRKAHTHLILQRRHLLRQLLLHRASPVPAERVDPTHQPVPAADNIHRLHPVVQNLSVKWGARGELPSRQIFQQIPPPKEKTNGTQQDRHQQGIRQRDKGEGILYEEKLEHHE